MITGSNAHPLVALIFIIGGAVAYFTYEVMRGLRLPLKLPVLTIITDAAYAFLVFVLFIALSHMFFDGRIEYYSVLCYFFGIVFVRLTSKPPIRKFLQFVSSLYNRLKKKHAITNCEVNNETKTMRSMQEKR